MSELNRLSCVRCKDRKVRCNRVMPTCDRCGAQDVECVYPVRQKRRVNRPAADRGALPNDALSTILDRLQRVEEQCVALPADSPHGDRSIAAASPSFTPRSGPTSVHAPLQSHSHASVTPSPAASTPAEPPTRTSWRPWTVSSVTTPTTAASPSVDATAVMKEAMDQVQRLRLRTYGSSVVTDEINIPPELAKQWIHNYFVQKPSDMFLSLIDKRFVEMMPDMLNFEHIHFDSCVLVIYYGVLWHGCCSFMERDPGTTEEVKKWVKLTYLGCLRAVPLWQREATGTITDMIAAITMARVAAESFDYEMAWQMFKTAGEYAKGLGMHNLDRHGGMMRGIHNPDISDDDRKSFWDLIQVDMFFRLIFNKPPAISGNAWQVNLPWLNPQSQPPPQPDTTMIFLVSSRVTLLLIRFFAMLEESTGDMRDVMARTEDMCREIQRLYEEWNVTEWAKTAAASCLETWVVADLALNGYTCIIFMLRKMATLDSNSPQPITTDTDVPDSPIALAAARHVVDIVGWLLEKYPTFTTLSSTFGAFRAYVPFAYLVSHILKNPDSSRYAADIQSLERAAKVVEDIANCERDFSPLARAMQGLNEEVRKKFETAGTPQPGGSWSHSYRVTDHNNRGTSS